MNNFLVCADIRWKTKSSIRVVVLQKINKSGKCVTRATISNTIVLLHFVVADLEMFLYIWTSTCWKMQEYSWQFTREYPPEIQWEPGLTVKLSEVYPSRLH